MFQCVITLSLLLCPLRHDPHYLLLEVWMYLDVGAGAGGVEAYSHLQGQE